MIHVGGPARRLGGPARRTGGTALRMAKKNFQNDDEKNTHNDKKQNKRRKISKKFSAAFLKNPQRISHLNIKNLISKN